MGLKQTITSLDGRTSRKSLILMVSFFVTILMGIYIVASDLIPGIDLNESAITVFNSMLLFVTTLTGITVADKKFTNQVDK